jgi:hypothetical protein
MSRRGSCFGKCLSNERKCSNGSLPTGRTFRGRPRFMRSPEDAGGGRVHARVALDARVLPQNPLCFRRALQGSPRPRGGFSRWYPACLLVKRQVAGNRSERRQAIRTIRLEMPLVGCGVIQFMRETKDLLAHSVSLSNSNLWI